jgi:hypothetical protein
VFSPCAFNEVNGNVNIPGNLSVVGNIAGNVQNAYLANFATVANSIAGANVSGQVNYAAIANSVVGANVSGAVANATYANLALYATTANSVAGANVSGQVANALIAGTVYTNAQPNITSTGILSNLSVSGNVTANYFIGDGGNISNVAVSTLSNGTSNISIPIANSHIYVSPNIANTAVFYNNGVSFISTVLSNAVVLAISGGISFNDGKVRIQASTSGNSNNQITIGATNAGMQSMLYLLEA